MPLGEYRTQLTAQTPSSCSRFYSQVYGAGGIVNTVGVLALHIQTSQPIMSPPTTS